MVFKKKYAKHGMKARVRENAPQETAAGVTAMVVGLGNPGKEYINTRHNAGFIAMDYITSSEGFRCDKIRFKSLVTVEMFAGVKTLFMKPQTFMNLSGEAVMGAMRYYDIPAERVILLVDDVAIDAGELRIRRKGTDGGQNGLKNIFYLTGTNEFPRVRIGVGKKPHPNYSLVDWVLGRFSAQEETLFAERLPDIKEAVALMLSGKTDEAMNRFTGKKKLVNKDEK